MLDKHKHKQLCNLWTSLVVVALASVVVLVVVVELQGDKLRREGKNEE